MRGPFAFVSLFENEEHSWLDRLSVNLFLGVLGSGILLAAWLLTQNATKQNLVQQLSLATLQGDVHHLNQSIDWTSIEYHLIDDLTNQTTTSNQEKLSQIAKYVASPSNLPVIIHYYRKAAHALGSSNALIQDIRFTGIREITVTLATPDSVNPKRLQPLDPTQLIFKLGLDGWKVKRILPPQSFLKPV